MATRLPDYSPYYLYQSSTFFELAGPILAVVTVIVVLALLHKNSEIQPLLAAGVPTFRLSLPLLVGTGIVNLALILNQEFVIPAIAPHLQSSRSPVSRRGERVEPLYDYDGEQSRLMYIDGDGIQVHRRTITNASFTLFPPRLVQQLTTFECHEARYASRQQTGSKSGWLLTGVRTNGDLSDLTSQGREIVIPQRNADELFIVSDVSFDQLYDRARNFRFASASELMRRIRHPAAGLAPARSQSLHLHFRFTRPLLNVAMVFACVPLVIRRESLSLIGNMAICSVVLGLMYLVGQAYLAAWLPVIVCGSVSAWLAGYVQT